METVGATSTGSAGPQSAEGSFRDRGPAPWFDGTKPERFKQCVKEVKLWRHETDIPRNKHGAKMLRQLGGAARAAADELEVDDVIGESGADKILAKLTEHFAPHLETAMPRAFEKAVYGEARKARESLGDFVIRCDAAFRDLYQEGVELSEQVQGYIMHRQANLTTAQDDQLTTWTEGKFQRRKIVAALRKLDKVSKEKNAKSTYVTEDPETYAEFEDYLDE